MSIKLYPVIELLDLHYAHKYRWLSKLTKVSDGIMLRPEKKLGDAFRNNETVRQYLSRKYGIFLPSKLKIMLDHGIFLSTTDFKQIFGIRKDPKTLIRIYDTLGVDYALAYDIPARLHVEFAVRIAISKIFNHQISNKLMEAIHYAVKPYFKKLVKELLLYIEENNYFDFNEQIARSKINKLIKPQESPKNPRIHKTLSLLSKMCVKETIRRLKRQLQFKVKTNGSFILLPVIQGVYEEHAMICLMKIINLLEKFYEIYNNYYIYIAIGTGGRVLSKYEVEIVNKIMKTGYDFAKDKGLTVRFHLLGWSSPKIASKLNLKLVYSSDSLTARRRAGEGKIYVIEDNKVKLKHVSEINPNTWDCKCIVCRDTKLRSLVLDPSGKRKNDVRMVHNLWIIKRCAENFMRNNC